MELFTVQPDGSNRRQLTIGGGDYPSWAGDGRKLAYLTGTNDQHVWLMNRDGTRPVALRIQPAGVEDVQLSPDGSKVVLQTATPDVGRVVWVAPVEGSTMTRLTSQPATTPAWSPDSRRIAYLVGGAEVWSVNVDGSDPRRLTTFAGHIGSIAWSPDGQKIALTADTAIYVVGADGTGLRRVRSDSAAFGTVSWSPDGKSLAFARYLYFSPASSGVAIVNLDGSGYSYVGVDSLWIMHPRWSPCLR